ncbi:phosphatase PAP2 family protein [Neisseria sp. S1]|uniref:phosphatase PAP2 family protein n=1 Tax=Neisseria sp. S1 TaxID=3318354 RepID=UPI003A894AB7
MKLNLPDALTVTDIRLLFWLNRHSRKRTIGILSREISRLGDGPLYACIGVMLWIFGGAKGTAFFYTGLAAYAIELPLYLVLKNSIRRNRPCHGVRDIHALIEPSDKFSFPSGHTAAAFVFATLTGIFFPAWAVAAYFSALLIGLSRVMLGVHYPSDIAAGAVLGILCVQTVLFFTG